VAYVTIYSRPQHVANRIEIDGLVGTDFANAFGQNGRGNTWSRRNVQDVSGHMGSTATDSFGRTVGGGVRWTVDPAIDVLNPLDENSNQSNNVQALQDILWSNGTRGSDLLLAHPTDEDVTLNWLQDPDAPDEGRTIETVEVEGREVFQITYYYRKEFNGQPIVYQDGDDFTAEDVYFTNNLLWKLQVPLYRGTWAQFVDLELLAEENAVRVTYRSDGLLMNGNIESGFLPKHIWEPVLNDALARVGASDLDSLTEEQVEEVRRILTEEYRPWEETNPVDPSLTQLVGLGPFVFAEHVEGEFFKTSWSSRYWANDPNDPRLTGALAALFGTTTLQEASADTQGWIPAMLEK
jgi:ABC-type transport system substrate-binding protein